jgi:hypothetical protein
MILPTLGFGLAAHPSRNTRLELNATGFTIPRRSAIYDVDATASVRAGHLEFRAGAKAFRFRFSTNNEFYTRGTMAAAFVGLRWYSD